MIHSHFSSHPSAVQFNYVPFKQYWQHADDAPSERVYDELYTGEAWINAHAQLQASVPKPNCNLERVIAAMMFWLDATQLAQFSSSSVWPLYLYFGNLSKWYRRKPTACVSEHIAFFPKVSGSFNFKLKALLIVFQKLPDSIKDDVLENSAPNKAARAPLITHLKQDLFHACWAILLDDEFLNAYQHGIVIECMDKVKRHIYP
jgi:hypothetical protein